MGIRRLVAIPTVALALAAFAPAPALAVGGGAAPGPTKEEPKEPPGPPPQLILFHGGSFLFEDPFFEPSTAERAIDAGFVPHYVQYPLNNMPAAVLRARGEAKRLRHRFGAGRVYAYGASAGGTLAAELSGDGLVAAAVAKAPVTDLVGWEWPLAAYGANYYEQVSLNEAARYRLSPDRRPQKSPLLIYQGRSDQVVPPVMNETFAAKYPRVYLWLVPGGHTTERARPYLIGKAMHWLARTAARQARAAAQDEALP
ncbi:MAG: prolyl oligopeptidase family serine peptidase [Solirubrobacterales bacterium]